LQTMPLFGEKKLIVVRDAQELSGKEWESLLQSYGSAATHFLLLRFAKPIAASVLKVFENGFVIKGIAEKSAQLASWVNLLAQEKGLKLDPTLHSYFLENVASDI